MEIKIIVDDAKFKDVIESELKAFSKEELHELIREAISTALLTNASLKNLFVTKDSYWGHEKPSDVMIAAANKIDLSPAYIDIQNRMIDELKNNYHRLLEKVMLDMFIAGLTGDYYFQQRMANEIRTIYYQERNNQ